MDGRAHELTRRQAHRFATDLLTAAQDAKQESHTVAMGDQGLRLGTTRSDRFGQLVQGAFIAAPGSPATARLTILRTSDLPLLPPADWARPWVNAAQEIPATVAYPYRIFLDRVVGVVYVLDQRSRDGVVWIRSESELDLRSFITPFRTMMSWLANLQDAEVVHAAGVHVGGLGLAFSGASGSGKSTLGMTLGMHDHEVISDDCLWVQGDRMYAVYNRAKVDAHARTLLKIEDHHLLVLPPTPHAKGVVELSKFTNFRLSATLDTLAFPVISSRPGWYPLAPRAALRMLSRDSLREIHGGRTRNHLRLAHLTASHPACRVLLANSPRANVETIEEVVAERAALASSTERE